MIGVRSFSVRRVRYVPNSTFIVIDKGYTQIGSYGFLATSPNLTTDPPTWKYVKHALGTAYIRCKNTCNYPI